MKNLTSIWEMGIDKYHQNTNYQWFHIATCLHVYNFQVQLPDRMYSGLQEIVPCSQGQVHAKMMLREMVCCTWQTLEVLYCTYESVKTLIHLFLKHTITLIWLQKIASWYIYHLQDTYYLTWLPGCPSVRVDSIGTYLGQVLGYTIFTIFLTT